MRPRICVVTTPNRDFNALFDYLDEIAPPAAGPNEGFRREGVPYRMRHHDHRFEASRAEFRAWACAAAAEFGYDVEFTGVGGLGRGLVVDDGDYSSGGVLEEAAAACGTAEMVPPGVSSGWPELKRLVCEVDDNEPGLNAARRRFGDCSQMAVFVMRPELELRLGNARASTLAEATVGPALRLAHRYELGCVADEQWPPDLKLMLGIMMANRLRHLCPELIVDEWKKPANEFVVDVLHRKERSQGYHPKDNNWGQRTWKGLSDEALRERDQLFARLGGRTWEVNAVEVVVEPHTIWETYTLQRACCNV